MTLSPFNFKERSIVFAGLVAMALMLVLTGCDDPTPAEKAENAADEVADGFEDASETLQDRSPAEKVEDAIEDTGDEIEEATE